MYGGGKNEGVLGSKIVRKGLVFIEGVQLSWGQQRRLLRGHIIWADMLYPTGCWPGDHICFRSDGR